MIGRVAAAAVLLLVWAGAVTERVLRRARPVTASGVHAVWRYPVPGLVGRVVSAVAESRLARALCRWLPLLSFASDITDVVYVNYLVPAERLLPLVPEGLELQRLGPGGGFALFTFLTYRHGHFGPRRLGPLRRLFPSPVQTNWRIHVLDPRTGLRGVHFVTNAIGNVVQALGARLMSEGMPMHVLARGEVLRTPEGAIHVTLDPGAGTAPDAELDLGAAGAHRAAPRAVDRVLRELPRAAGVRGAAGPGDGDAAVARHGVAAGDRSRHPARRVRAAPGRGALAGGAGSRGGGRAAVLPRGSGGVRVHGGGAGSAASRYRPANAEHLIGSVPEDAMDISLPQNDPDRAARAAALAKARAELTYDYQALPQVPLANQVPAGAGPSVDWTLKVADVLIELSMNAAKVRREASERARFQELHEAVKTVAHPMQSVLAELKNRVETADQTARAAALDEFRGLFVSVPKPRLPTQFLHDHTFARMRVAGPAPVQIRRMRGIDTRFPVTGAMFKAAMGAQDTLDAAGAEGRLYLADYAALDGLPAGTYPSAQKYLPAPLALFAVPRGRSQRRSLVPVAIQLGQRPGPKNPIFVPDDGQGWEIAKSLVQTADGNLHQAVHHFAHTHLVLEPFAVATLRQLSVRHPLGSLLRVHIEGTLYINSSAISNLIAPGGGVNAVMAGRIDAVHDVIGSTVRAYHFDDAMLLRDLVSRGVDDADILPDYPYRDDARLVWDALHRWINAYVRLYYPSSAEVVADPELQAWAAEIMASDGGRVKGFGERGRIETVEYLVDALTHLIFTASAQHAAVNFPQGDISDFAPAVPLAAYAPAPTSKVGITEQTYWDLLPPLGQAHYQMVLGRLLGSVYHTRLGDYPTRWGVSLGLLGVQQLGLYDRRVEPLLQAFQQSLREVEETIQEHNAVRTIYPYLLPSQIPQSINI